MLWLTQDATLVCDHGGRVGVATSQKLVTIKGRLALINANPEQRPIAACPNANPVIGLRPCLTSLNVKQGYSTLVTIVGRAVALDTVTGLTDGSPPGTVNYRVVDPGQRLVAAGS